MMESDIKLEAVSVVLEGNSVECHAPDLKVDFAPRRSPSNPKPFRRALVHDFDDSLTLNFDSDYKSVRIGSKLLVKGDLVVEGDLVFDKGDRRIHLVIEPDVNTSAESMAMLSVTLQELQARIAKLEKKVGA